MFLILFVCLSHNIIGAPSHLVEFPVGRTVKTTQVMVQWSYWHACCYLSRYNEPFQISSKQIIAVYMLQLICIIR